MGATKRGKGTKIMAIADRNGLPVALWATSARPHETKLVEELLIQRSLSTLPQKLVGDRAYDSDPLDKLCLRQGVELITKGQDSHQIFLLKSEGHKDSLKLNSSKVERNTYYKPLHPSLT